MLARPVAVALVLGVMRANARDIAFVAWVGLRGAVPIILATFPLVEGVEHADLVFNVVFFIVLTSVLLQGSTLPLVARWLGVAEPPEPASQSIDDLVDDADERARTASVVHSPGAGAIGRQIVDLDLPSDALIVLIRRGQENVVPQGSTVLAAADQLTLIAGEESLRDVRTDAARQRRARRLSCSARSAQATDPVVVSSASASRGRAHAHPRRGVVAGARQGRRLVVASEPRESLGGNYVLQMRMNDLSTADATDQISFALWDVRKTGSGKNATTTQLLLFSSNRDGNQTQLQRLAGGNLFVHPR